MFRSNDCISTFSFSRSSRGGFTSTYRYGFNDKENDQEDGYQDYGMRQYNPRLGRFFSVDPITSKYPELTPYQFASNTPISAIDLDGLEGATGVMPPGSTPQLSIEDAKAIKNAIVNFFSNWQGDEEDETWQGNSKLTGKVVKVYGDGPTVENKKDLPAPGAKASIWDKAILDALAKRATAYKIKSKSDKNNSSDGKGSNSDRSKGTNFSKPVAVSKFVKEALEKVSDNNTFKMGKTYEQQESMTSNTFKSGKTFEGQQNPPPDTIAETNSNGEETNKTVVKKQ